RGRRGDREGWTSRFPTGPSPRRTDRRARGGGRRPGSSPRGHPRGAAPRARGSRSFPARPRGHITLWPQPGSWARPGAAAGLLALGVWGARPGSPAAAEGVVVALGDSLTAGYGVAQDEAWPALVDAQLRQEGYAYRVVNAGVSGDTTAGGLRRVDWALRAGP